MARSRKSERGTADIRLANAFWALLEHHRLANITVGMVAEQAELNRGTFYNHFRDKDDLLAQLEAEGSEDLDAVSGCFGELMAELFDYRQDHWSPELRSIGFHLGKFIYLLDAYDDLARDEKKGSYNPLRTLSRQPGYEEEMREIFELLLARCARSFERLPCVEDADLLRNILYSGVWLKYNCKQAKETPKK